ncbi:MAG: methyltransferase domain-containing protein [Theionarchaea archaeon]|nr:methyltransferase domain-containing protein [Theionarchaea archaeon]
MKKDSWYEDDTFWEMVAPFLFDEMRWAATPGEVDHIVELLGVDPPASVLDLCCGPGRHALELARRHYAVTGVDRTTVYLERAEKQAEKEGISIEFIQEDMRTFCRPESFDGAIMMFTSFGYFEEDEDRIVLENVCKSLKDKGRLLLDVKGKEIVARTFTERDWREKDGIFHLEERKIVENWTRTNNRWIIIDGDSRKEVQFLLRIYSAHELCTLLQECGFSSVNVFGNMEGKPYDHAAKRLIAVAQKILG